MHLSHTSARVPHKPGISTSSADFLGSDLKTTSLEHLRPPRRDKSTPSALGNLLKSPSHAGNEESKFFLLLLLLLLLLKLPSHLVMSADFWAGYMSGVVGIVVGNPLDIIKVRLQCSGPPRTRTSAASSSRHALSSRSLILGAAGPALGYGALNALLFTTYNRTLTLLNPHDDHGPSRPSTLFSAGAVGGLATWVIATPTELVKCRVQAPSAAGGLSSLAVAKSIFRSEGLRSLYLGGKITALRDGIGYGIYFSAYELATRYASSFHHQSGSFEEAAKVLLCGGLTGTLSWACVYPLDMIKTRVQTQPLKWVTKSGLTGKVLAQRSGALEIARMAYRREGFRIFFQGLTVCSLRAFLVNAIQWIVYEKVMSGLVRDQALPRLGRVEELKA